MSMHLTCKVRKRIRFASLSRQFLGMRYSLQMLPWAD